MANPIDIIVQTSTVELFRHYGLVIAPISRADAPHESARTEQEAYGTLSFRGDEMEGHLMLCMPLSVVRKTLASGNAKTHAEFDWIRELTGQLMGRIKNRLARAQVKVSYGLPAASTSGSRPRLPAASAELHTYQFRSLNGNLSVILSGRVHPRGLVYAGGSPMVEEGDVLLF